MPTTSPDRFKILKPDTGLRDDQRVRGWRDLPRSDEGLEIRNGGNRQIDIVTPPCYHGIAAQPGMRMLLEEPQEVLPYLIRTSLFEEGRANKRIRIAGRISTGRPLGLQRPEIGPTGTALLSHEVMLLEES